MPYILDEAREQLKKTRVAMNAGELNYLITKLCVEYVEDLGKSYTNYNTIIGALECAKQEFYRRAVVPYEIEKCAINGDVY